MKNLNDLHVLFTNDRAAYRETVATLSNAVATLEHVYNQTRELRVNDTVKAYVDAVGLDAAISTVATLVNIYSPFDGRIFPSVRQWAESCPNAWDEYACERMGLHTQIHCAHLNQIAQELSAF